MMDIVRETADMITVIYALVYFVIVALAYGASKGTDYAKKKNAAGASILMAIIGTLVVPYGIYEWTYTSYGGSTEYFEWYAPGLALMGLMWFISISLAIAAYADPSKNVVQSQAPPYYPSNQYQDSTGYGQQQANYDPYQSTQASHYGQSQGPTPEPLPWEQSQPYQGYQVQTPPQPKACPYCGFQANPGATFCGDCGRSLV